MSWFYLVLAIACEVVGTTCMKLSEGFTRPWPSAALFVAYGASLGLLTLALKGLDVSVAYAVWSGLGTALVAAIGVVAFGEELSVPKVACLLLIVAGVVGLNFSSGMH